MTRPKFAVRVQNFIPQTGRVRKPRSDLDVYFEMALKAEKFGYDAVTMYDHLYKSNTHVRVARRVLGPGLTIMPDTMPELWTTLTHMASITKRIRIVANVVSINFRAPSLLASMASTLDNISSGRLEVGLGAGGDREETNAYGLTRPSDPASRAQKLEEYVEILKLMWTEDRPSYRGKFFSINNAYAPLKPLQKPHPPINVGGSDSNLLRVAARHANIVTPALFCGGNEAFAKMKMIFGNLQKECRTVGREYDEITKAVIFRLMLAETREDLTGKLKKWLPREFGLEEYKSMVYSCTPVICKEIVDKYVDAGVSYFLLDFMDAPDMDGIELFAKEIARKT